jgi:hypothetical protein
MSQYSRYSPEMVGQRPVDDGTEKLEQGLHGVLKANPECCSVRLRSQACMLHLGSQACMPPPPPHRAPHLPPPPRQAAPPLPPLQAPTWQVGQPLPHHTLHLPNPLPHHTPWAHPGHPPGSPNRTAFLAPPMISDSFTLRGSSVPTSRILGGRGGEVGMRKGEEERGGDDGGRGRW